MLWYKAWLETRWRFLIGLAVLLLSATGVTLSYPRVVELLPFVPDLEGAGEIARRIREAAELARSYRGYVWSQWFGQNLPQLWTLFAVILGSGGLLAQSAGGGALFALSLPVTRNRWLAVRAAVALGQLLLLALVPSLLVPVLSPAIGEAYSVGDALAHSACLFIAGTVLFSGTLLLSTVFADVWRPLLIALCAAVALAVAEQLVPTVARYGLFRVMTAESYFRGTGIPWSGLLAAVATSAGMLYAASRNIARQDF